MTKINLLVKLFLGVLLFCSFDSFAQQDSKQEEKARYEASKIREQRAKQDLERKFNYSVKLNSNASETDFNKAVSDLVESKKFITVKSEFTNKRIELKAKEAIIPEEIKAIISKSGLGISSYISE